MSNDWSANNHWHWGHDNDGPITGPDGQPILAGVGDLGDTVISGGGTAPSGSSGDGGTGLSPVGGSGAGLVINVTYDQPVNTLPTGFVSAINYVVNYLESLFSTPTTVNIDVGFGEIGGQGMEANALGESESFLAGYNYSTIKSALAATDPSAAASLPASQPVSGSMWVSTAEAKALGLSLAQPAADLDGYVGFSSALPFTYDPNNRAVAGKYDFIGVAEHEFTELMGRIDLFNATLSDGTTTIPNTYSLLDMYHYTSSGVHTYTGTTPNYFSADGGHTNLIAFNSDASGDLGDWASSAGADSFLAFSPSGQIDVMSQADITTMNALGYQSAVLSPVTIESAGSTALVQLGSNYELNPVGGGTGPTLFFNGSAVTPTLLGGWTPIGAEAITGEYEVAFKLAGQDRYTVWDTDSSGHYVSNAIGAVTGATTVLEALETSFHQDLNGDGTIGVPLATVESFGSTSLADVGNNYEMNPVSGGTGPFLYFNESLVTPSLLGGWSPIGAEAISGGYEVAFKFTGQDLYTIWNTDSSGNYVSSGIGAVSGGTAAFETLETSFHQDLNGDGTIGAPSATIESFGSTSLVTVGSNYEMNPVSGGSGPFLHFNGSLVTPSLLGGWSPIGAEAISGGYEVAFKFTGQDLYTIWNTDSSGNYVSSGIGAVSGGTAAFETLETSFHQDLNGDGAIGAPSATIESFGSTSLVTVGSNYEMNSVSGGSGPFLHFNGSLVTPSLLGGWSPIGAEAISGGYEVALKVAGQNTYTVWDTDSSGSYTSNAIGAVAGNAAALESLEPSFHQDLNGDGTTGVVSGALAAGGNGTVTVYASGGGTGQDAALILGVAEPQLHGHDFS